MVNINSIERDKRNIIKNFSNEEMSTYLETLTVLLWILFRTGFRKTFSS